jgi:hypothetical protein
MAGAASVTGAASAGASSAETILPKHVHANLEASQVRALCASFFVVLGKRSVRVQGCANMNNSESWEKLLKAGRST